MSVPVVPEPPDHSTQSQSLFSYEFSGAVFDPAVDSKSQSQILPFLLSESLSLQSVPLLAEGDADKGSATKGIADKGKFNQDTSFDPKIATSSFPASTTMYSGSRYRQPRPRRRSASQDSFGGPVYPRKLESSPSMQAQLNKTLSQWEEEADQEYDQARGKVLVAATPDPSQESSPEINDPAAQPPPAQQPRTRMRSLSPMNAEKSTRSQEDLSAHDALLGSSQSFSMSAASSTPFSIHLSQSQDDAVMDAEEPPDPRLPMVNHFQNINMDYDAADLEPTQPTEAVLASRRRAAEALLQPQPEVNYSKVLANLDDDDPPAEEFCAPSGSSKNGPPKIEQDDDEDIVPDSMEGRLDENGVYTYTTKAVKDDKGKQKASYRGSKPRPTLCDNNPKDSRRPTEVIPSSIPAENGSIDPAAAHPALETSLAVETKPSRKRQRLEVSGPQEEAVPSEEDDDDLDPPTPVGAKRKRGAGKQRLGKPKPVNRPMRRKTLMKATPAKARAMRQTTAGRSTSLHQVTPGIAPISVDQAATRVYAPWNDIFWWAGTITGFTRPGLCMVNFDDGYSTEVAVASLRQCTLREGDRVWLNDHINFLVSEVEESEKFKAENGKAYRFSDVRIMDWSIKEGWNDRTLDSFIPMDIKAECESPVKASRAGQVKIFTSCAFIITVTQDDADDERKSPKAKKEETTNLITENGGIVAGDWSELVSFGDQGVSGAHWSLTRVDAGWVGPESIRSVFVLADEENMKPKFLLAIALGVPCLRLGWIEESASTGVLQDWRRYLLPQGFSVYHGTKLSQQVDWNWGSSLSTTAEIMHSRLARKLFLNKSVVCVGKDLVPVPESKKAKTSAFNIQNVVCYIVLAMGAETVTAVRTAKDKKEDVWAHDYVVFKDENLFQGPPRTSTAIALRWTDVKQSLVAGRIVGA